MLVVYFVVLFFFFFKQKTAYEMRISDWSSDVCSSDLVKSGDLVSVFAEQRSQSAPQPARRSGQQHAHRRSEERRVGKELSVRVDLGGRRIIKKKTIQQILNSPNNIQPTVQYLAYVTHN